MPDPSGAMLHKTTGVNVKESELIQSGRDTTYSVHNNYNIGGENGAWFVTVFWLLRIPTVFQDVIGFFQIAAQLVVAWAGMNQSTDGNGRGSEVKISSIMPPDPSSLPVSTIADRYTRSMLECMVGYPLYEPHPFDQLSEEYSRHGANIGDVGYVREDGTFDVLFNICPPQNGRINPPNLPDGFSLETPEHSKTRRMRPLSRETCLYPTTVTITKSGEYICEGTEGAVLELPEGAIQDEAMSIGQFEDLAKLYGVEWYRYTITRGRGISNGSLYLVTSITKCTQWGIAVFDRRCDPGQGLTFVSSPLGWKGSRAFATKVADPNQGNTPNQCVFLRGYKIMIRQDIFDDLRTRRRAQRIRGGGGTDFMSRILSGGNPLVRTMSTVKKSDEVVLLPSFNSSPVHPSDLVNAALLHQNPDAKVALTHDDIWCDLLRDNFPKFNYVALMNVAQSYKSMIDKYGCISLEKSLEKIPNSSDMHDESSHPVRGTEIPAIQKSIQDARDERNPNISMPAQTSATLRPLSVDHSLDTGDENFSVAPQAPPTISAPHSLRDKEAQSRETRDSKPEDTVAGTNANPNSTSLGSPEGLLDYITYLNPSDDTLKAKPFIQTQPGGMTKRQHALQELLLSERAYLSLFPIIASLVELIVNPEYQGHGGTIPTPQTSSQDSSASSSRTQSTAPDISHIHCSPPMSMDDTKIIFNNVQELALFSDSLCDKLENAIGTGDGDDHVGALFLSMINEFEAPYKYYITRHPTALTHLQNLPQTPALTNYLSRTQIVASAVSHAWDLSSLLIKPVQRLLGYPPRLLAIYEETPDGHPDKENLEVARKKMEEVARNVNEGRRRAEVVKEVLSSKKPLSAVNLTKKKDIRVDFNRLPADADSIEALKVERMHMELKRVDSFAQQFARNVLDWSISMSNVVVALRVWAINFGKVIGLSVKQGSEAFDAFLSVVEEQLMPLCVSLEAAVNDKLLKKIAHLLYSMTQPFKLLASMIEQEPLHHHLLTMNVNNRRPPANLLEASNNYRALRDQLAAELPGYLLLLHKGLTILTRRLVAIQTEFWRAVRNRWGVLWNMLRVDGEMNTEYEEIIKVWRIRWTEVDDLVSSIKITQRRELYTEILFRSRNLADGFVQSRKTSPTTGNVANVLSAPELTHVSLTRTQARGSSSVPAPRLLSATSSTTTLRTAPISSTHLSQTLYSESGPLEADDYNDKKGKRTSSVNRSAGGRHPPGPLSATSSTTTLRTVPISLASTHSSQTLYSESGPLEADDYNDKKGKRTSSVRRSAGGRPPRPLSVTSSTTTSRTAPISFTSTHSSQTLYSESGPPDADDYNDKKGKRTNSVKRSAGGRHLAESFKTIASLFNSGFSALPLSTAAASDELWLTVNNNDPRTLTESQRDNWINREAKYVCRVIHSCVPPASVSYFSFPFFTLVEDDMYEVLQEAGHPSMHPKLPLYVDDGEDCLLLCRDVHRNVGWALASFLEPLDSVPVPVDHTR